MVTEEYLQANARLHGQARDKNQAELSSWAQSQDYDVSSKPVVPKKAKQPKGSQQDWERAKAAAKAKREQEEAADKPSNDDDDSPSLEGFF
jgi:hypothetical protein